MKYSWQWLWEMISEGYRMTLSWPVLRYFSGNCTVTAEKSEEELQDSQSLYWKLKLRPQICVQTTVVILCYSYHGYSYIHYINQWMHTAWQDMTYFTHTFCLHEIPLGWYSSRQISVYILQINVDTCKLVCEEGHCHISVPQHCKFVPVNFVYFRILIF